jgi:hypothetical protein
LNNAAHQTLLQRLCVDQGGGTAVEYGLLSCIMALVLLSFAASGMSPGDFLHRLSRLPQVLTGAGSETVQTPVRQAR